MFTDPSLATCAASHDDVSVDAGVVSAVADGTEKVRSEIAVTTTATVPRRMRVETRAFERSMVSFSWTDVSTLSALVEHQMALDLGLDTAFHDGEGEPGSRVR